MRTFAICLVWASLLAPIAANSATYTYDISTQQQYGLITGTLTLTDDGSGHITGGSAALGGAGLAGTVDFNVVTHPLYCGGACYGWRSGDGTDFYGFSNSFSRSKLNDVVLSSSATTGSGYTFGIYSVGSGHFEDGLFGPGASLNFYDYGVATTLVSTAVPEAATWSMMLLGFAGLGYAGLARRRGPKPIRMTKLD